MHIDEKRREIDTIDAEILDMLNRRSVIAKEISLLKMSAGLPVADEQREEEILRRLTQTNAGPVDDEAIVQIYRTILAESRRIQANARKIMVTNGAIR